ncbi:hypothetical protein GCM10027605_51070 [Micromonospora zhanjiangensis]
MGSDHAITADGLRKRYAGSPALDGFDLQVGAGTIHGLLGPNGAGKSTAVKALATLIDLDAGVARIDGFDVRTRPGRCAGGSAWSASTRPSTRSWAAGRTW